MARSGWNKKSAALCKTPLDSYEVDIPTIELRRRVPIFFRGGARQFLTAARYRLGRPQKQPTGRWER